MKQTYAATVGSGFYLAPHKESKLRKVTMNIRRITRYWLVLTIAVLIVCFSACDSEMAEDLNDEISVGVVLSITGRLASTSTVANGLELALEEINNAKDGERNIKFIREDDKSTVEGAIEAYNKLIQQDEVPVILGPATSTQVQAVFPIAQENRVVAFSPTSSARGLSAIGDFVFRAALTTDVLIPVGIERTYAKIGYKNAATLYDESDVFSTDSDEAVREALASNGVEVLITETFQGGDTDFSNQLTRIRDANPDIIFISALTQEKPGILTQGRQVGIPNSVPFVIRTLTAADVGAAGEAAEGAFTFVGWVSTADTPGNQAFVRNYSKKFGVDPDNFAARSYAALYVLAEAIANARSTDAAAIRDALANITNFDTVFGPFSFNSVGDAVYDPTVLIVENGQLKVFE